MVEGPGKDRKGMPVEDRQTIRIGCASPLIKYRAL